MVAITASNLQTLVNDTSISAASAEAILMQAARKITLNGYTLTVLSGTSGSMTATYTDAEAAALLDVAVTIYSGTYKNSGSQSKSVNVGSWSQSTSSSTTNAQQVNETAKQAATQLRLLNNEPPIYVSNPPIY